MKTIAIFTFQIPDAAQWDPDSLQSGITGSEEAVIFMSEQLVKLGYKVLVLGDPPAKSRYSHQDANPHYIQRKAYDGSKVDIAISWRSPMMAEQIKQFSSKVYLWPHDTYGPSLTHDQINGFDDVLWLSEWQREHWISANPGFAKFTKIFGNGINPESFKELQEKPNPYSCIYGSNYARGLEILLDIWPEVKNTYPLATLDIYYGWQHWGLLTDEKEAKMRSQIQTLKNLGVLEHGLVGQHELTKAFEKASLWTYPCIDLEVFCITALRAQASGCIPVIVEGSALKETVRYGYKCTHPREYLQTLLHAMSEVNLIPLSKRQAEREFIFKEFTWKHLAQKWHELFEA